MGQQRHLVAPAEAPYPLLFPASFREASPRTHPRTPLPPGPQRSQRGGDGGASDLLEGPFPQPSRPTAPSSQGTPRAQIPKAAARAERLHSPLELRDAGQGCVLGLNFLT